MAALTVLLVCVIGLCGWLLWRQSARGLLADKVRKQVVVTLKSGSAFKGLLSAVDRDAVVLVEAAAVKAGELIPVDGEVIVLRAQLDYMQRP